MTAISVKNHDHWHELRSHTVGGSEIASLFYAWSLPGDGAVVYRHLYEPVIEGAVCLGCVSRHTTGYRLWHIKSGKLPADDLDGVERIEAGRHLEPALAAWASDKWDDWSGKLRKVHRYLVHPNVSGLGASRDYELHTAGLPPVEFKNVDYLIFRDQWAAEGDDITAPPMDITLQVMHQIAADNSRADHGWIIACVGGNRLLRGRIEAHAPTIDRIKEAVRAFWTGIETGTPPDDIADYDTIADLYASGGGTFRDLSADNRLPDLCARLTKVKAKRKQAEQIEDALKAQIGLRLGEATKATAAGFSLSWPVVNRKASVRTVTAATYRGALTIKETL